MNTPRSDVLASLFPKWEATPEILEWAEDLLRPFSQEQVKLAARQHKTERGKAYDPDVGELVRRLKGTGTRHAVQVQDPREQLAAYNARPNTPEDDRWDALCDSWRADLRTAKTQPGFTPEGWARSAFPLFARDIAAFGHTSKTFATAYLVRIANQCGVKIKPKGANPEAMALIKLTTEAA